MRAPHARAAANDEVVWLDGKESPVGVAIRCGRSSIAGRLRPTASLIDVEVAQAAPIDAVARSQRRRRPRSTKAAAAPVASQTAPCSPRCEYRRTHVTVS